MSNLLSILSDSYIQEFFITKDRAGLKTKFDIGSCPIRLSINLAPPA